MRWSALSGWLLLVVPVWADGAADLHSCRQTIAQLQAELKLVRGEAARWEHIYQQEKYIRRGDTLREHLDNPWDISLAWSLIDVALIQARETRWDEAEQLARRALAIIEKNQRGSDHPARAAVLQHLAHFRWQQGDSASADYFYREAIALFEQHLGDRHARYAAALNARATMLRAVQRLDEAEQMYRKAVEVYQASPSSGTASDLAAPLHNLALLLMAKEQYADAELLLQQAAQAQQRRPPAPLDQQALVHRSLARLYLRLNELDRALQHEEQAVLLEARAHGR